MRRTNLLGLVLIVVAVATLVVAEGVAKTFPASSGGKLELDLDAGGSAAIEGSGGHAVEVTYTDDCSPACEVQFEETRDGLKIRTSFAKTSHNQSSDIELKIKVPAQFDIEVGSVGGGISIDGVEGSFTGKTAGGELTLRHVRGEAELQTMGGDIRLSDSELDGSLKTMGGEVNFENVVGDV